MSGKGAPKVPDGWKAQFDDKYQTWFYVNLNSGKSQWEAPEGTTFEGKLIHSADLDSRLRN